MQTLSGSKDGFGGDLRFGETGPGAGLRGADRICAATAESSLPGAGSTTWRAFLSTTSGAPMDNGPVHAVDRIGAGPWYDRVGRLVASDLSQLLMERPGDAAPEIRNDLPNETGLPNREDGYPDCANFSCPDNHDVLTGTGKDGKLYDSNPLYTCDDWTSSGPLGVPWCGHSWPRQESGKNWISAHNAEGCSPGTNLVDQGAAQPGLHSVGAGGGYGAIYCFLSQP